jgi:hypothetical protein
MCMLIQNRIGRLRNTNNIGQHFDREFGFERQAFVEVFHEKHGRRHCHRVYSRSNPMERSSSRPMGKRSEELSRSSLAGDSCWGGTTRRLWLPWSAPMRGHEVYSHVRVTFPSSRWEARASARVFGGADPVVRPGARGLESRLRVPLPTQSSLDGARIHPSGGPAPARAGTSRLRSDCLNNDWQHNYI